MVTNELYRIPVCEMKELNNLFIELTAKNCNQHCKHCYIDFPITKAKKDYISQETIKTALNDTTQENIYCIYLTGAEPMLHPDFNSILRMCLKRTNVCICTNGSFLNEKKVRFLKKVEDESTNEIIFMLPIDHYEEIKNDDIRGRGAFRQIIHASQKLEKYDFNPIYTVTNFYNENEKTLIEGLKKVFLSSSVQVQDFNFQINKYYNKYSNKDNIVENFNQNHIDCSCGRILTEKGVYSCPFLANDYRGRMGTDFKNYSKKVMLETPFCWTCSKNKENMFSINYKYFNS